MNPFKRMMKRLEVLRARSQGRSKLLQPYEDDSGDAAGGGVPARLPNVPPRSSGANALTIPREAEFTEVRGTENV